MMPPNVRQALAEKRRKQREAHSLLEKQPGYPHARVEMHEGTKNIQPAVSEEETRTDTKLDYLLKIFDIHAEAFVVLVASIEIHKAFVIMLEEMAEHTWNRYMGFQPGATLPPVGEWKIKAARIGERIEHWQHEGFRHLSSLMEAPQPSDVSTPEKAVKKQRKISEPQPELLKDVESVTKTRAAAALGVSLRTLDRYVKRHRLTPVGPVGRKRLKTRDLIRFMNSKNDRQPRQE